MAGTYRPFNSYGNSMRAMRNNPQFQELEQAQSGARSSGRGGYGFAVNPSTRAASSQLANAEANRLRSLDEFGIENRLAREALEFDKRRKANEFDLRMKNLAFNNQMMDKEQALRMRGIQYDRDARHDSARGANLGLAIGLGQMGLDYYDKNQERQRMADLQAEQERRHQEYLAAMTGRPYEELIQNEPYNQVDDTVNLLNRAYRERMTGYKDPMYYGSSRFDFAEPEAPRGMQFGIFNDVGGY